MPEKLAKGARLTGPSRERLAADLRQQYERGDVSIRDIAAETGRSYGFIHRLLSESGVKLRGRGGATRRRKKSQPSQHQSQQQQSTPTPQPPQQRQGEPQPEASSSSNQQPPRF